MLAEMIFIVLSTELMSFDFIVRCCINIGVSIFGPIDLLVAQSANPLPDGLHGSLSALDLHDLIDHPASDSVYEVEGFGFTISQISHTLRSRSQVSYPLHWYWRDISETCGYGNYFVPTAVFLIYFRPILEVMYIYNQHLLRYQSSPLGSKTFISAF